MTQTRKREHGGKPDERYELIERCSASNYLELLARGEREGWAVWCDQAEETDAPTCKTYSYNPSVAAEQ